MNGSSPFWYKSGGFLWGGFTAGLVLVVGAGLPLLYHQHLELEGQKEKLVNAKRYIAGNKPFIQSAESELRVPTQGELSTLRRKLPTEMDFPLFLKDLEANATASGVKWTGARFALKEEDLEKYLSQDKTIEQKLLEEIMKPESTKPAFTTKPLPKHVRIVWADVYLDATLTQLKAWFEKLKTMERMFSIVEWENRVVAEGAGKGNTRVRFAIYVYQDPELKFPSNSQSSKATSPPASTQPIEILPPAAEEQENKEKSEQNNSANQNSMQPGSGISSSLPNTPDSGDRLKDTGSVTKPSS